MRIAVAARASPLSQAQVREVQLLLPGVELVPCLRATHGDLDLTTSLRTLDKTDFFTREVDDLLLSGSCRVAIHSAKDLPAKIPQGLSIVAITAGVDSSDSLVLRSGESLEQLPQGARIATSSQRREENVRQLRDDFKFIDIRGPIAQRLEKLHMHEADGVVVAEAALIRLRLTHLNRVLLPGETTPLQGQLAILARADDREMEALFAPLDTRPRVLFLGLETPPDDSFHKWLPFPIIQTAARPFHELQGLLEKLPLATHLIFGSKHAVEYFSKLTNHPFENKVCIAVGPATAQKLRQLGARTILIAKKIQTEGIIDLLSQLDLSEAFICWPHSALSRPLLKDTLHAWNIPFFDCILYDTLPHKPGELPEQFDSLYFTSSSTVEAFLQLYGEFPPGKKLIGIGEITRLTLAKYAQLKENQTITEPSTEEIHHGTAMLC